MTNNRKKKVQTTEDAKVKGFLDMIAPSVIQFYTDHYICGNILPVCLGSSGNIRQQQMNRQSCGILVKWMV